jgi:hypothetical protein
MLKRPIVVDIATTVIAAGIGGAIAAPALDAHGHGGGLSTLAVGLAGYTLVLLSPAIAPWIRHIARVTRRELERR